MAGPLRTITRIFEPTSFPNGNRELHSIFVSYFDGHPGFQRIASNYGTSGTGLSGSFVFSGSSGENAWVVYRAVSSSIPYDIAFVWSYYDVYASNTWTESTNYGFGFSMAWHPSLQAWSGSVNNNGLDTFFTADKPWKSGSIVFPRANGSGGTYVTNKNCVLKPYGDSIENDQIWQLTIIGDNDATFAFLQNSDQNLIGDARYFFAFGQYTPLSSSFNLPLFCLSFEDLNKNNDIGSTANGQVAYNANGGISYSTTSDVRTFRVEYPQYASRKAPRPAASLFPIGNNITYKFPINLISWESGHYHHVGILSGCFVVPANAFGNLQDISRSYVSLKPKMTGNVCLLLPFSGSADFFLKGSF